MYEDNSVEEKYLHNFSPKEKEKFLSQNRARRYAMDQYEAKLLGMIYEDSPAVFENREPKPNTFLEIKYVLNRIAANDARDTVFEVSEIDSVRHADKLAIQIAKSFQKNTVCQKVILHGIGLTDKGIMPILNVLRQKELVLLDLSGNKITDKTVNMIDRILSCPETRWKQICLGKIRLGKEQSGIMKCHTNLSFTPLTPVVSWRERIKNRFMLLLNRGNER
jgi:hypothetical protein